MAQSDFDFASAGSASFFGGIEGTARLNSVMSNPLTIHGDYCREFKNDVTGTIGMSATLNSSVANGAFVEVPKQKKISVRALIRSSDVSVGSNAVGIGCKLYSGAPESSNQAPRGYSVMIGDTGQTSASSDIRFYADNGGTSSITSTGVTATDNNWFWVRLDVIPADTSATPDDLIRVYTSPTGSESWSLQYSLTIASTDAWYVPWAQSGNGKIGFWIVNDNTTHELHIDSFQAFIEDAFA
jgi:hypothetical protein